MKKAITALLLLSGLTLSAQNDVLLYINDTIRKLDSSKEYEFLVNGKTTRIKIVLRDTLTYESDLLSFNYLKDHNIYREQIAEGIEQIIVNNTEGSVIIIQEYSLVNPLLFPEKMIHDIARDRQEEGFEVKWQDYIRETGSGTKAEVIKAILTYKEYTNIYEISAFGRKDEGIVVLTMMINATKNVDGQNMIDHLWNTLVFKE